MADTCFSGERWRQFESLIDPKTKEKTIRKGWSRSHSNGQVVRIKAVFRLATSEQMTPVSVLQAMDTLAGLRKGRTDRPADTAGAGRA